MRNISRLLRDLRHENHILFGIDAVKRAQGVRELITEYQTQTFHSLNHSGTRARIMREASYLRKRARCAS